jgi:hypothetical protein
MNYRKLPISVRKPSIDAWYTEPAKTVLYTEYFGVDTPPSASGNIKVFDGASFVPKPVKVWSGSAWVTKPLKRWNGSAWVATNY